MKELTEKSIVLAASNLAIRVAGYVYRILMGRMLSPYEFGILNLALPLQYMVMFLTSSGIAPSVAKFVAESEAKKDEAGKASMVSSSLLFSFLIGAGIGAAFALLAAPISTSFFHDANVALPFAVIALSIPFSFVLAVFTGAFQGLKRMDYMSFALLATQALRILLALALVYFSAQALNAALGSTLGAVAALPLAYLLFLKLDQRLSAHSWQHFRSVFLFSLPLSATAVATSAIAYVDTILLGFYFSPVEVGIYSAASPTSRLVLVLSSALYAVLIPSISELRIRNRALEIKKYTRDAYQIFLIVSIPASALAIYFAEPIITLLFSESYAQAAKPFQILLAGTLFFGIFNLNAGIFQGLNKPKLPMNILILTTIIDVVLNLALIPAYGMEGAAIATSASLAFAGVFSTVALRKGI